MYKIKVEGYEIKKKENCTDKLILTFLLFIAVGILLIIFS